MEVDMAEPVIVFIGFPKRSTGGGLANYGKAHYFATKEEVPDGIELADQPETDIADIMRMNSWSKEVALQMMNS
jgi:hypothetical protein